MRKIFNNTPTTWILLITLAGWFQLPQARDTFAATLLFSTGFETGTVDSLFPLNCNSPANTIVGTDNGIAPHSGTHMFKYDPFGHDTSGGCTTSITPAASLYLSKWWYFPSDFDTTGGHLGGNHVFRFPQFWQGGQAGFQWDNGLGDLRQGCGQPITYDTIAFFDTDIDYNTVATFPKGRWFHFEGLWRLNTPGVANGAIDLWIDGSHVYSLTGQFWLNAGDNVTLSVFSLTTNFDNFTCPRTATSRVWYEDDVQVWNECPTTGASCSSAYSDLTPPSPPAGLKVQ